MSGQEWLLLFERQRKNNLAVAALKATIGMTVLVYQRIVGAQSFGRIKINGWKLDFSAARGHGAVSIR
jgi:hypothetical protein